MYILQLKLCTCISAPSWSRYRKSSEPSQRRLVARGRSSAVYSVDSLHPVEFDVALENFERCQGCVISLEKVGVPQSVLLEDYEGRSLRLTVATEMMGGCALKVRWDAVYIPL